MSKQSLITTRTNFIQLLAAIGFELGRGWDHEVWCDVSSPWNNFWLHFQSGGDPFETQGPIPREFNSYRVDPDAPTIDAGAFLRYWREACVEEAVEAALEANR